MYWIQFIYIACFKSIHIPLHFFINIHIMSRFSDLYRDCTVDREILYMKSIIFWDMTPCSPLSFNRRFGGTYRLHLQGRRNGFSKPASKVASWRWRRYVPPKRRLKPNRLHGIISQKMILFITTAVKTSNPTIIKHVYQNVTLLLSGTAYNLYTQRVPKVIEFPSLLC
jgi:hypothetical protein